MKFKNTLVQIFSNNQGTENTLILLLTAFLLAMGILLPSEKIALILAENSDMKIKHIVSGVVLFKWGLLINGLILLLLRVFYLCTRNNSDANLITCPSKDSNKKKIFQYWFPLLIILFVAIILRIIGLNSGLWYDEIATLVEFVRLPIKQLITNYGDQNNHPLFSLLAGISIKLFGESAWSLRLPAVLFGLTSIWALFILARLVTDKQEALFATILMSVTYHHVWFSQNARGYTGMLFWGLMGTWFFLKGCSKNRPFYWIVYAVSMSLGMYTHLTTAFILISHFIIYVSIVLWLIVHKKEYSVVTFIWPLISFFLVAFFTFQLYSLILPQVIQSFQVQVGGERVEKWTNPLWAILEVLRGLQIGFGTIFAGGIASCIFLFGLISYSKSNRIMVALFTIPVIFGTITLLLLHRHFYPRFFFFIIGIGILIFIRGCNVIPNWIGKCLNFSDSKINIIRTSLASIVIALSLLSLSFNYRYPKQDYISALNYIKKNRDKNDFIVSTGLASYAYKKYYATDMITIDTVDEILEIVKNNKPVWLIYTFSDHMDSFHPEITSIIKNSFTLIKTFPGTIGGGTIYICKSKPSFI